MTSRKTQSHSNLMLLLVAALVIIASVYFWRKKAHAATCQEICYSTSPTGEESCDVICTTPATESAEESAPAA